LLLCYFLVVRKLLNAGTSPDCSNEDGLTVLHQVCDLVCPSRQTTYTVPAEMKRAEVTLATSL